MPLNSKLHNWEMKTLKASSLWITNLAREETLTNGRRSRGRRSPNENSEFFHIGSRRFSRPKIHVAASDRIDKETSRFLGTRAVNCFSRNIKFANGRNKKYIWKRLIAGKIGGEMQIKDKRVVVTGAASDVGLAFSRELLRNGALMIVMIDIRQSLGERAVDSLNNEFGRKRAVFLRCDVTNNSEFDATFKEAINILGGLDILINNAGVINETDFAKAIDVNVTAVIRGTLLGIQQMRKDCGGKGGVIVNISSIAGLRGVSQLPVYSTTKHAVVSFSRSFAQPYHYERTNVKIIVLCPGLTDIPVEDLQGISNVDILQNYRPQRVESIAHGLIYVIRCAQNGSVWICEDGKPVYEVQLPDTLPQKTEVDAEN